MKHLLPHVILILITSCSLDPSEADRILIPQNYVTPEQCLRIAESYTTHQWTPTEKNQFHGVDAGGISINTPDISFRSPTGKRLGWWVPHKINVGMPYKWGGFDTPNSFNAKIRLGKYAGDVYTSRKRAALSAAVSPYSTGVDCSGFISRCWRLSRHHSTREFPKICYRLNDYRSLSAGDILNKENDHAILFSHFTGKYSFIGYEAASEDVCRVRKLTLDMRYFIENGYKPLRYKNINKRVGSLSIGYPPQKDPLQLPQGQAQIQRYPQPLLPLQR